MPNNLLIIAQAFPPRTGAAARRLAGLAERMAPAYEQIFVIRLDRGEGAAQAQPYQMVSLPANDLRQRVGVATVRQTDEPAWKKELRRWRQAYPLVYLTDDGGPDYRQKAYAEACRLIEQNRIDTVLTSFRPWSDHLVAKRLKKRYPALRWIADFRDLPVDPVRRDVPLPVLQKRWGKHVIASASELWCVSEGQREQLLGWHPKIKVVRHHLAKLPPEITEPVTDHFTIVYTGSLYPGLQTIQPLVLTLHNLIEKQRIDPALLRFVYRGKDDDLFHQWTRGLPTDCLDIKTTIAPAAAQKMQSRAQVLLLLTWSAADYYGVLTAKLWDYLASGRPVLALVNGPGDAELSEIITGADAGAVFAINEQGELEEMVAALYKSWMTGKAIRHQPNNTFLQHFLE